jgi:DNA-binding response OmpR family regulator
MVKTEKPDIVILDLGLPDTDGFEVLRQVRLFSAIPILVLTAKSDEKDVVSMLDGGANDYVIKPFRQLELLARLKTQLIQSMTNNIKAFLTESASQNSAPQIQK